MKFVGKNFIFLIIIQLAACRNMPAEKAAIHGATKPIDATAEPWNLLVVEQGAGKVSKIEAATGNKLAEVQVGYNPHEIAISADRQTAYVSNFGIEDYDRTIGTPGTTISVIDIPSMTIRSTFATNRNPGELNNKAPHGIRLRPGRETELYVNTEIGDSMLVYDIHSGQIQRSFPLPPGAHNFIFSPDGDTLFLFAGEQGIFSFNPDSGAILHHFLTNSPTRGLAYTIGHRYLIVSCGDEIYLLTPADLSVYKHFGQLGVRQIIYSTATPDGKYILAPAPYDGLVLVLNIDTGIIEKKIEAGKAPIYVQIAPTRNLAFVANALDDHLSVLDLETFEIRNFAQVEKPNGFGFLRPQND